MPHSPTVVPLGCLFADPYACSATRTSINVRSLGGAAHSLGVLAPKGQVGWKRSLSVPFEKRFAVTAATWEGASGQGSLLFDLQPTRKQNRGKPRMVRLGTAATFSVGYRSRESDPDFLRLADVPARPHAIATIRRVLPHSLQRPSHIRLLGSQARQQQGKLPNGRLPQRGKRPKPRQSFRVELKRDAKCDSITMNKEDMKYGKLSFSLTPARRVASSIVVKEAFWKRFGRRQRSSRNNSHRQTKSGYSDRIGVVLKSDMEYRWKENCFSMFGAVEAFNGGIGLNTKTSPLRFTPRVQVPFGKGKSAPWIGWIREPGSGMGELQLGRQGLELSTDWPRRTRVSLKQRATDGSIMRLSLNRKGVFVVDKTLISKPLLGGFIATLSAHVTNTRPGTAVNASLHGPLGVISAAVSATRSFDMLVELNVSKHNRVHSIALRIEESKRIAARLGLYL